MIKLSQACLGPEEEAAVINVLRHDGYLGMGKETIAFEKELETFLKDTSSGSVSLCCCHTGTAALHLATQALGIGPGDEVLIPSITYIASFQAVSATGAKAVAVDIDPNTGAIDLNSAKSFITSKTKAIMPVLYAGSMHMANDVYAFAKDNGLYVIEDAAHGFGQPFSFHDHVVTCISFDSIKNITCGEGGVVFSQNTRIIEKIKDLRLLGVEKDSDQRAKGGRSWDFDVKEQGWRYHMSNINAAIGRAQLKKIHSFLKRRTDIVNRYLKEISHPRIQMLNIDWRAPHIFPMLFLGNRDQFRQDLLKEGIETGAHYKANHLLSFYRTPYDLKGAEFFSEHVMSLPLHVNLSDADVSAVIEKVQKL
jgi:dTDP-4-amino-4,6-dideoxygalactose transaminase